MKMSNTILNDINLNDKKWNFTKTLIKKALELNGTISAQDHTYIESAFDITQEVKENVNKALDNIFDDNEELSISYVFHNYDTNFSITIYTEIDFIYFIKIPCDSNLDMNKAIKMLCDKTPNYNVAISIQSKDGHRKYFKNC